MPISVTTADADRKLGVLQAEGDCDCGMLVAMAVLESLVATLKEGDIAAVALACNDAAGVSVARPVPTNVAGTDGDCNMLGDKSPLADAIASALAEGDSTVLSLSSNVAPALALA